MGEPLYIIFKYANECGVDCMVHLIEQDMLVELEQKSYVCFCQI